MMNERANQPGPGRSTSQAALNEVKKKIAERNAQAHQAAKKLREPREREKVDKRRRADLL
jgi:hypothetical protein